MNQIDKPILDFRAERVTMKTLGQLCKIRTGPNINKQIIANNPGEFPVINSGKEPLGHFGEFNVDDDPIGIASRGSVGLVTWTPGRYFRGNLNYSCTIKDPTLLDRRFLYHYLLKSDKEIQALATHQGIPALNASNLRLLQVPVPPLEVQREIVRVLDKFTQLEAELEAELEARRRQYEYYRNHLLGFPKDTSWAPIGEIAEIRSGWGFPKSYQGQTAGSIPFYKVSDMNLAGNETTMENANNYVCEKALRELRVNLAPAGTVIFPKIGAAIATNKKRLLSIDSAYDNNVMGIIPGPKLESRFLLYWMQQIDLTRLAHHSGAVPSIRKTEMEQLKIPIPPIEEQRRIVSILDKFDSLVNDLSVGLPAELAARRKQYEYYRDRLLTFEEKR